MKLENELAKEKSISNTESVATAITNPQNKLEDELAKEQMNQYVDSLLTSMKFEHFLSDLSYHLLSSRYNRTERRQALESIKSKMKSTIDRL